MASNQCYSKDYVILCDIVVFRGGTFAANFRVIRCFLLEVDMESIMNFVTELMSRLSRSELPFFAIAVLLNVELIAELYAFTSCAIQTATFESSFSID